MASQNFEPINFPDFKDKSDSENPLLATLFLFFAISVTFLFIYFLYVCARRRPAAAPAEMAAAAAAAGLDPAAISSLPVSAYANKPPSRAAECAICLSLFQEGEKVKALPLCRHRFHSDCVDEWLRTRSSCPLCRGGVRRVDPLSRDPEAGRWVCAGAG